MRVGFFQKSVLRNWWFYHIIFWIIVFASFCVDLVEYATYDVFGYLATVFIRTSILAVIFYLHFSVLIPHFLQKKKWLVYIAGIVLTIFLFSVVYNNVYFISSYELSEIYHKIHVFNLLNNSFTAVRYLIISGLFSILQNWFEQEKKLNEMSVDKLRTELNYLRAQINPHFLFNTLNNLYALAIKKSDKTPEVIMKLSDMMDYMLYEGNDLSVPLTKDIENLINYIEIERIRQGNNARIEMEMAGDITNQKIIPLLLLPLVENGFQHGVNRVTRDGFIKIKLLVNGKYLEFSVANNLADKGSDNRNSHGIGLENLKRRLALFYPGRHELITTVNDNVFYTAIKLAL